MSNRPTEVETRRGACDSRLSGTRERAIHKGNPDTLTSRDYVYTEWDRVKHFAEEFLELCGTHTPAK